MKYIIVNLCLSLICGSAMATTYRFNAKLISQSAAPTFVQSGNVLVYNGTNPQEATFFSGYTIQKFYQTYPKSTSASLICYYTFETTSSGLREGLLNTFPSKYVKILDETEMPSLVYTPYYPNDYGSSSPVANLGANLNLHSFDYINTPKAWFYTKGDSVLIGMSDSKIYNTDSDLSNVVGFTELYDSWGYDTLPFAAGNSIATHGTSTTEIAAGIGNNAHGITGVCADCTVYGGVFSYADLYSLAEAGARVINMSWASSSLNQQSIDTYQEVINELHDTYDVVFVAAAGNDNSFYYKASDPQTFYQYPASLEHVISVTGINHLYEFGENVFLHPTYGEVAQYSEDRVAQYIALDYQGIVQPVAWSTSYGLLTLNDKVDISAPGYQVPLYSSYLLTGNPSYGNATSPAAPYVSGTAALMFSLNDCLMADEVEDIIQLCSKNIEVVVGNEPFLGMMGAGKLETGDAVEFVSEMMNSGGNALIDGQDFYRFDFHLNHIINDLTISNQIFRDANTSEFTAGNAIEILSGDFHPETAGYQDLKIDSGIQVCDASARHIPPSSASQGTKETLAHGKLYPNPNNGRFVVDMRDYGKSVYKVKIFNTVGSLIREMSFDDVSQTLDIPELAAGLYFVEVSDSRMKETFRFIRK